MASRARSRRSGSGLFPNASSMAIAASSSPTATISLRRSATIDCSLNATDWKRLCQEANAIPQAARRANLPRG